MPIHNIHIGKLKYVNMYANYYLLIMSFENIQLFIL